MGLPSNVFFQLVVISWMVTLSSCLIGQVISFIPPLNEYGCVYAWTTLVNNATLIWKSWQCCRMCTDFERREAPSAPYIRNLVKKEKKIGILIGKPMREKSKTVAPFWRSEMRFDTVGLLFVGCHKYKFYANKPEAIDALKDNIRKAIGEIQLHTIDNVLKN